MTEEFSGVTNLMRLLEVRGAASLTQPDTCQAQYLGNSHTLPSANHSNRSEQAIVLHLNIFTFLR